MCIWKFVFFIRTPDTVMYPWKACLAHQYLFLNSHHFDFVKKELILQIDLKICVLQHLLLLAYRLSSWPVRRHRIWKDERKGRRRHPKRRKDTRNQEGREGKEDAHKKSRAHLFGRFISALLPEVLHLSQFSKGIDG